MQTFSPQVALELESLGVRAGSNFIKYVPVKPRRRLGRNWSLEKGSELPRVTRAIESSLTSLYWLHVSCLLSHPHLQRPSNVSALAKSVCFPPGCFNCYPMTMLAGPVTEHSLNYERGSAYSCTPDPAGKGPSCHLQPTFGSKARRTRRPGSTVPPKATLLL